MTAQFFYHFIRGHLNTSVSLFFKMGLHKHPVMWHTHITSLLLKSILHTYFKEHSLMLINVMYFNNSSSPILMCFKPQHQPHYIVDRWFLPQCVLLSITVRLKSPLSVNYDYMYKWMDQAIKHFV